MLRTLLFFAGFALFLAQACQPPISIKHINGLTGLDSVFYAGVAEDPRTLDLREARHLARIKVGDFGVTLDCRYADALGHATRVARRMGGNLLVITEHTRNTVKSNCHRIKANVYRVPKLEGMENRIWWHPERRLLGGDLRGKRDSFPPAALPQIKTEISGRLGGDYYNEAFARTETIFYCDSTYPPATDPQRETWILRRAQAHFDLSELHARRLKAAVAELGPNLDALVKQIAPLTVRQQTLLRTEQESLEADITKSGDAKDQILARWETQIARELAALGSYAGELRVDLRVKKKK
ncbi:MAG: hypothetical protein ABMA02_13545 [Saprospiraceae bacterium]